MGLRPATDWRERWLSFHREACCRPSCFFQLKLLLVFVAVHLTVAGISLAPSLPLVTWTDLPMSNISNFDVVLRNKDVY